jgi:hypothetical protein
LMASLVRVDKGSMARFQRLEFTSVPSTWLSPWL